jgi:hypothetical protein
VTASLDALCVYPLKGGRGIAAERWPLDAFGLRFDRRWMAVTPEGRAITQRTHPRLALISPLLGPDSLTLRAPDGAPLVLPLEAPSAPHRVVRIWGDIVAAADLGDGAARWITDALGAAARLVHMPGDSVREVNRAYGREGDRVGFADAYPFLLVSQGSLDDLNRRLERPVPMNRFRPNLVVEGVAPFAEDGWARIEIGGVAFDVVKPCARCTVPTIDQDTAERGQEPIRTLAMYRRAGTDVYFGQNLIHRGAGELAVGAAAVVLEHRRPLVLGG